MNNEEQLYNHPFDSKSLLNNIDENKNNYERYKNDKISSYNKTQQYERNNIFESDAININKSINKPWPIEMNKSHNPVTSDFVKDINQEYYQKSITTSISINSIDRDVSKYPYSNQFKIDFNNMFNNVNKIEVTDIKMPNFPPINQYNNALGWKYISRTVLQLGKLSYRIIPFFDLAHPINYASYTTAAVDASDPNLLTYVTTIPTGFYNTETLVQSLRKNTNLVLHGGTITNRGLDTQYITLGTSDVMIQADANTTYTNKYENPYYDTHVGVGTPHLFDFTINPDNSVVQVVNRMEEVFIMSMQSFVSETAIADIQINDIYDSFSNHTNTLSSDYIYILIPRNSVTLMYCSEATFPIQGSTVNPFPLVVTKLKSSIGGIHQDLINYTIFYHYKIYYDNGYTNENNISYVSTYKYFDTITFTVGPRQFKFLRLGLHLSTGNLNGLQRQSGHYVVPSCVQTLFFQDYWSNMFSSNTVSSCKGNAFMTNEINTGAIVGRALLFSFWTDIDKGNYVDYEVLSYSEKKRSVLSLLAWPIANKTVNFDSNAIMPKFRFVHANYFDYYIDNNLINNSDFFIVNASPQKQLNIEQDNGRYFFRGDDFIFMKIRIDQTDQNYISTNLIQAIDSINQQYNVSYNVGLYSPSLGQDITCLINNPTASMSTPTNDLILRTKSNDNLFIKVLMDNIPSNYTTIKQNIGGSIFYNTPINKFSSVYIELYDSHMRLLNNLKDFSFNLNVYEIINVMKDTLINTKNNTIHTTGMIH